MEMKKLGKCLKVMILAVVIFVSASFKTQVFAESTSQSIVNAGKNWLSIGQQQQGTGS